MYYLIFLFLLPLVFIVFKRLYSVIGPDKILNSEYITQNVYYHLPQSNKPIMYLQKMFLRKR
jgi:hypothetical protein